MVAHHFLKYHHKLLKLRYIDLIDITQTIQSIQEAIKAAELKSSTEIKNVVVGIAGQHIRSLQHSDYITRENPD